MEIKGKQFIGFETSAQSDLTYSAVNPATGQKILPSFFEATRDEIDAAAEKAKQVADQYRVQSPEKKAGFLEAIADGISTLGEPLLERAHKETGLPLSRLQGERNRTVNQIRLLAEVVREGSWINARIDRGDTNRQPFPKPDVRQMLMPIGPVVVFGASNFPLAISVAGSDTISALGAGCPVIVKAHPGHPGTSELVASVIISAAKKTGMPDGIFSLLHGSRHEVSLALVRHPSVAAVAFTGSLRGGRALWDAAAMRPNPIPVYAEMGSTNPVFILPSALKERSDQIADGYIQSVTLGVGQFCTNPGVVFGLRGERLQAFIRSAQLYARKTRPATMLHAGIKKAFDAGVGSFEKTERVNLIGTSEQDAEPGREEAACRIYETDLETYESNPHLAEEVFGPSSIIVKGEDKDALERIAERFEGHLTATIHGTEEDLIEYERLVTILERKVGRLIFNGFPTGIEVCAAMFHGGPYPATTDSHYTSIGTASIYRFARPICYQNFPDESLPEELRNTNTRHIWRMIDNEFTRDSCQV